MESMIIVSESELNGRGEKEVRVAPTSNIPPTPTRIPTTKRRKSFLKNLFLLLFFPNFPPTALPLHCHPNSLLFASAEQTLALFILYQNAGSPHRRQITAWYFSGVFVLSPQLASRLLKGITASFTAS